jgi:hypothetical protein
MADAAALKQYAERHGLSYETQKRVPLLGGLVDTTGTSDHALSGTLPGGFEGTIALLSWPADDESDAASETIAVTRISESIAFIPKLYCRDAAYRHTRSYTLGATGLESDYRDTEFESEAVNRTWAVQVADDQDQAWLRELFIPTFLDWLGQRSPKDFRFALVEGTLSCGVEGELDEPDELDRLCALAAHVANRIRTESLEEERPAVAFSEPLPPPRATEKRRLADAAVAKLDWDEPPPDMISAARAYRGVAHHGRGVWGPAILLGGGVGLLIVVVTLPFAFLFGFADFGTFGAATYGVGTAAVAIGFGAWLTWAARRSQVQKRALLYGQRAFVHEYASSRGLRLEDEREFHARFLHLDLPGPARSVMFGRPAEIDRDARLLLCSDTSGASAGFEAAVVEASAARCAPDTPAGEDGIAVETQGGCVIAYRPTKPGVGPSVEGLDAVSRRAAAAAGGG